MTTHDARFTIYDLRATQGALERLPGVAVSLRNFVAWLQAVVE